MCFEVETKLTTKNEFSQKTLVFMQLYIYGLAYWACFTSFIKDHNYSLYSLVKSHWITEINYFAQVCFFVYTLITHSMAVLCKQQHTKSWLTCFMQEHTSLIGMMHGTFTGSSVEHLANHGSIFSNGGTKRNRCSHYTW